MRKFLLVLLFLPSVLAADKWNGVEIISLNGQAVAYNGTGIIFEDLGMGPTLLSATINSAGDTITLAWGESVTCDEVTSLLDTNLFGTSAGISGYVSGCDGSASIVYSLDPVAQDADTVTANFGAAWTGSGGVNAGISGFSVTNNSTADTIVPVVVTATINGAGNQLTVVLSEAVTHGTSHGMDLNPSITGYVLAYNGGDGTSTIVYDLSGGVIQAGDTILMSEVAGGAFVDLAENLSGAFTDFSVTNNSTQDTVAPTLVSAVFTDAATLLLTFSETVTGPGGFDADGFFIDDGHASNEIVTCISSSPSLDNHITCAGVFSGGETLDYTAGLVTDIATNPLADFTGVTITGP